MGILILKYDPPTSDGNRASLDTSEFDQFDSALLGFTESEERESFEALAAVVDLEDFTSFCNKPGYDLVVPEFLRKFSQWLFNTISEDLVRDQNESKTILHAPLPRYAKFLGDGVLFLWDIRDSGPLSIGKIVLILRQICEKYKKTFLLEIEESLGVNVPAKLRCGIARGPVFSIGAKQDYVGPCINIASRLQKLEKFSFAFWKIGFFDLGPYFNAEQKSFILIYPPIRGFRDREPVIVLKREFNQLTLDERSRLRP